MAIITRTYQPFMLVGRVYAKAYGSTAGYRHVGNVDAFALAQEEEVIKQTDMTRLGGGTYAEVRRINEINVTLTLKDLNAQNAKWAVLGNAAEVAGGTSSMEVVAKKGDYYPVPEGNASSVTVSKAGGTVPVADERHESISDGDTFELVDVPINNIVELRIGTALGTVLNTSKYTVSGKTVTIAIDAGLTDSDLYANYSKAGSSSSVTETGNWVADGGGITILSDATDIADNDALTVSYSYSAHAHIDALKTGKAEVSLVFEGRNEADGGGKIKCEIYRASLGAAKALDLITGSDFGSIELEGSVLKDPTKEQGGTSDYYRITME